MRSRALHPAAGHDSAGVAPLLTDLDFAALLADKAFDSDAIRADLDDRGAAAVIPPKANRVTTIPCDFEMYKWRHELRGLCHDVGLCFVAALVNQVCINFVRKAPELEDLLQAGGHQDAGLFTGKGDAHEEKDNPIPKGSEFLMDGFFEHRQDQRLMLLMDVLVD